MNNGIKNALDRRLQSVVWTEEDARRALAQIRGETKMKKRLTFAMALVITLLLVSFAALAVTQAARVLLNQAAQMDREGAFQSWGLNEKLRFVSAMREYGCQINEEDIAILSDESVSDEERMAAADRIIDKEYGDLMREHVKSWVQQPDTVLGMPPQMTVIFRKAYYDEYPDATEQDLRDALTRWQAEQSKAYPYESQETQAPDIDSDGAKNAVRSRMTEVLGWSAEAAESAEITVIYNDEYNVWECAASADAKAVDASFEPITEEPYVMREGDSYTFNVLIGENGNDLGDLTPAQYAEKLASQPVWNITADEAFLIAASAVKEKYGLSDAQIDAYFIGTGDRYTDENKNARIAVLFKRHAGGATDDWDYAVIVNCGTARADELFTPSDLWDDRLEALAEAYLDMTWEQRLDYLRWYGVTYNPEGGPSGWTEHEKERFCALFAPLVKRVLAENPDYYDQAVEAVTGR